MVRRTVVRSVVAAGAVFVSLGVVGCGSEGADTPDGSTATETSESSQADAQPLAGMDPCESLSTEEVAQLALEGGEENSLGSARSCDWDSTDGPGNLRVGLYDEKSLDELNLSEAQVEVTSVDGREAKLSRDHVGSGDCTLNVAVSESSAVTVAATARETESACQLAEQAAPLVAAKLPQE